MAKKAYDPLAMIPCAAAIRTKLDEIELLCRRLKILLEVAERIEKEEPMKPVSR